MRCFNRNGFGHVFSRCRRKTRCTKCGEVGLHKWSDGKVDSPKCATCKGSHRADDKQCPAYAKQVEINKAQVTQKLSYAEALNSVNNRCNYQSNMSEDYPSLPKTAGRSPIAYRPPPTKKIQTTVENASATATDADAVQTMELCNVDFNSNSLFGNPIFFLAFLMEVIMLTLTVQKNGQTD